MPKTRILRSKAGEETPILKENEIVKFANFIDGRERYWSYVEYVVEEQENKENVQQLEKYKRKKKELCEYEGIKFEVELEYYSDDMIGEYYYVDSELGNENLRKIREEYGKIIQRNLESENKKLKKVLKLLKEKGLGVEVLTDKVESGERFEHFHITFQCNCLETITKEEYELLDEVLNG